MPEKHSAVSMPPSPGSLLRNKRAEYGWSVADVARTLCLSVGQMEAIEDDDYKNLPGRTYILGYWKSYAALLGISIEESISAHIKNLPGMVSSIALQPDHQQFRRSVERSHHRFTFLLVGLSVLFLGAIWYWQSPESDDSTEQGDSHSGNIGRSETVGEPAELVAPVLPQSPSTSPSLSPEIPLPRVLNGETESPGNAQYPTLPDPIIVLPEPSFTDPNDSQQFDAGDGAPVSGEGAFPNPAQQPAESADAHSTQTGTVSDAAPAQAESPPNTPPAEIIFSTTEESWLEVRDNVGERLIYRLVEPDRRLTLKGIPPFSVFVGNAGGISVEYLGEPVQFKSGRDGRFARFSVGTE